MAVYYKSYKLEEDGTLPPPPLNHSDYYYNVCWGFKRHGFKGPIHDDSDGLIVSIRPDYNASAYFDYLMSLPRMSHITMVKRSSKKYFFYVPWDVKQTKSAWLNIMQLLRYPQSYDGARWFKKLVDAGLSPDRAFCICMCLNSVKVYPANGDDTPVAAVGLTWQEVLQWERGLANLPLDKVNTFSNNKTGSKKYSKDTGYRFISGLVSSRTCLPCSLINAPNMRTHSLIGLVIGDTWDTDGFSETTIKIYKEKSVAMGLAEFTKRVNLTPSLIRDLVPYINEKVDAA